MNVPLVTGQGQLVMTAEDLKDKRAAILKATLDLISIQGFHATPMSQLAQEAKVGVGTIYRYFDNKEDLINALYTDIKSRISQSLLAGYSDNLPVRSRFILICNNFINYYLQHPKELKFLEQYSNSPFISSSSRQEGIRTMEPIGEFLSYAQQQEIVKAMPIEILSALIYGSIVTLVKFQLGGNLVLDSKNRDFALEALWDAVKR